MAVSFAACSTDQLEASISPLSPSSILLRLRLETRDEHNAVERVLDLMSAALTSDGYRQRLAQFYGFYAPFEKKLEKKLKDHDDLQPCAGHTPSPPPGTRAALASRLNKTALLQLDLQHLGVNTDELPLCHKLPLAETQADILGCLYVMEGATLGGRLITRHVQTTLGITPATGCSFFDGYGDHTGTMWQGMRQLLVNAAVDPATENRMVVSAIATFTCLRQWCQANHPQTTT